MPGGGTDLHWVLVFFGPFLFSSDLKPAFLPHIAAVVDQMRLCSSSSSSSYSIIAMFAHHPSVTRSVTISGSLHIAHHCPIGEQGKWMNTYIIIYEHVSKRQITSMCVLTSMGKFTIWCHRNEDQVECLKAAVHLAERGSILVSAWRSLQ